MTFRRNIQKQTCKIHSSVLWIFRPKCHQNQSLQFRAIPFQSRCVFWDTVYMQEFTFRLTIYSHLWNWFHKIQRLNGMFHGSAASSDDVFEWVSEQCFTSPPTQYRLYGRRILQVKRPNQQYQSTEAWRRCYKRERKQRKQL